MASISSTEEQRIVALAATVGMTRDDLDALARELDQRPSFTDSNRCARAVEAAVRARVAQSRPAPAQTVIQDRSAARVAHMIGVGASRSTGSCHYCGLPLNTRGACDECR